jgi:hypothetical protein
MVLSGRCRANSRVDVSLIVNLDLKQHHLRDCPDALGVCLVRCVANW